MTVTYSAQVANARLSAFSRLLFYWKGSIYKLMYKEMFFFIGLYAACSLVYRFALGDWQRRIFEKIALHCETFTNLIPLSFVLGFYVAIVVTRWWNQFLNIPWPDRLGLYVATLVEGFDAHSRLVRRTIMRYVMQSTLLVFQATAVSVKKRFPTIEHLIEAGVMTSQECEMLEEVNTPHGKWWVPFNWCFNLVKEVRQEGLITDDYLLKTVMEELMTYRSNLGMLYNYDWISIPLVYTQVTTLAVYTFFLGCVLGRQFLDPDQGYMGHEVDLYVPVFTLLQFFFYMGWMKVAEQMINPFGEDDDDFDMNWIIDRNMQLSMLFVDDMYSVYPKLEQDMYWDEPPPPYLPYTKSALGSIKKPFMGSTAELSITEDQMKVINPMETIRENQLFECNASILHLPGNQSKMASTTGSPLSSPNHGRRSATSNLLIGHLNLRSQLSLSKSTLDGLKFQSIQEKCAPAEPGTVKPLLQSLVGSSVVPKAPSYIEGWLHQEPGSRFDISTVQAKLPSPLTHHKNLNHYIAREGQAMTPTGQGDADYNPSETSSMFSSDKRESTVHSPSVIINIDVSDSKSPEPVSGDVTSTASPAKAVAVTSEDGGGSGEPDPQFGSENSLIGCEPPESNQSTVNSMTPLLKSATPPDQSG